jgi:hypothetical protein
MSPQSNKYNGVALCVSVTSANAVGKHSWTVTLAASDHKGHHKLGYRASGVLDNLVSLASGFPIEVHDRDRDVWTTMNPGDRKDIRLRIESLVANAMKAMSEGGH